MRFRKRGRLVPKVAEVILNECEVLAACETYLNARDIVTGDRMCFDTSKRTGRIEVVFQDVTPAEGK